MGGFWLRCLVKLIVVEIVRASIKRAFWGDTFRSYHQDYQPERSDPKCNNCQRWMFKSSFHKQTYVCPSCKSKAPEMPVSEYNLRTGRRGGEA